GVTRFAADLEGSGLRLRFEEPAPAACVEGCVLHTEANLFAERGSITSVRYAGTTSYRRAN
ncbi:hypothetical protein, partial [Rubrivirga sp.]|uniref:hypothetical protein n=1 Tax=Rubrivirga sp. TaxID=1885344 RepID=UPI003C71CAA4